MQNKVLLKEKKKSNGKPTIAYDKKIKKLYFSSTVISVQVINRQSDKAKDPYFKML